MRPHVTYRGYIITPNAIPYPYKWRWEHEDYDGAPEHSESGPVDFRHGEELTIEDLMDETDEMLYEKYGLSQDEISYIEDCMDEIDQMEDQP